MVFTSCIEQPTEKLAVPEQNPKLALVKSWFDTHRYELKIGDSRDSYRTESNELILPFFEKEPDWDKFHIFQFPDGREVYEISLANAELYFPSYLSDSIPGMEPNKAVIQNIMFVENKENGRFDPVIARYYPNNENSIREFGEIYYNMIDLGWSGTIDIWTYDERHFIGFNILEGELVSTVRYDTGIEENAKVISGHNFLTVDCFRVPTYLSYTYTTTGYYETTVVATQNYATICSSGGSAAPGYGNDSGVTYPYLGPSDGGGSGSYGSVGEPSYTPPTVPNPIIIEFLEFSFESNPGIKDYSKLSSSEKFIHILSHLKLSMIQKKPLDLRKIFSNMPLKARNGGMIENFTAPVIINGKQYAIYFEFGIDSKWSTIKYFPDIKENINGDFNWNFYLENSNSIRGALITVPRELNNYFLNNYYP